MLCQSFLLHLPLHPSFFLPIPPPASLIIVLQRRSSSSACPEQAGCKISATGRNSRSPPCLRAHLPPTALATLRHHRCQCKVKTHHQQGQFQATELSFNHVSPTNVRRYYMAKSLQAVLNIWKLILHLLLGQRNRTARWHPQWLTETGRTEKD